MSKLFKDLKYDTDYVMQPGDPLTSSDGHTTVSADNSGKAKISAPTGSFKHPKIVFAAGSYVTGTVGTYTWNNETTYDFSSWTPDNPVSDYTNVDGLQLWWNSLDGYTFSINMPGSIGCPYIFEVSNPESYSPTMSGMHSNGGSYNPSFVGTVTITRDPILGTKTVATEDQIPTLDQMTSPDGETVVVKANNDGTFKKITKESAPKECLYATFDASGHTVAMSFNHTKDELLAGISEIEFTVTYDGTDYACSAVNPGGGGSYVDYVQIRSDLSWLVGAGTEIDSSGVVVIFGVGAGSPVPGALVGGWVNSTTTKQIVQTVEREVATIDDIPSAATSNPKMDGTAAVGTSTKYAKEDHVHPTDTSRAAASHTHSSLKNGNYTASLPTLTANSTLELTGHTHSDYVSKSATTAQTMHGSLSFERASGDERWMDIYFPPSVATNPHILVGNDSVYTWIEPDSIKYTPDEETNITTLYFPAAAKSGVIATEYDIRRMSRVMYELVIGDDSTPATTVPVTEDYNFYKFWIGSNGVFPTFTFSFPDFSSTPALFPFTVYAHVDSSATTLTGPSGWLWVSGAGLPTSNFAGKGIWMSGVISTNEQNAVPLMSCWRVA